MAPIDIQTDLVTLAALLMTWEKATAHSMNTMVLSILEPGSMIHAMGRDSTLNQMDPNMMENILMDSSTAEVLTLSQTALVMMEYSNTGRDTEEARLRNLQERSMKECGRKMSSTEKEDSLNPMEPDMLESSSMEEKMEEA